MTNGNNSENQERIREAVREGYSQIAKSSGGCGCGTGGGAASCCGSGSAAQVAQVAGYSEAELATLPEGANMGLSCGNPTAVASLQPGEIVLDLGSGGGFDVFISGQKVGPTGRVIGVDMTPDMITKARRNTAAYRERTGLDNVEFRLGEIEHLPVADASVDVVISNCVLNLSPDKPQVWREIGRILKPGGRVAVSDLALLQPLPDAVLQMVEALIGCVAGAVLVDDTRRMAEEAGLTGITLTPKAGYVEAFGEWKDPLYQKIAAGLPVGAKVGEYIASVDVSARKKNEGAGACCGSVSQADEIPRSVYTPQVAELVAIGAAIAANCESCFRYHYGQAHQLKVSREDMALAVAMAQAVKEAPARAILEMAEKHLKTSASREEAGVPPAGTCCGTAGQSGCGCGQ